mgnify:FL=1|uniref:hypothetical protein n=1 Tax=Candidatus Stercorousia sp. TaxID=3048886 RepID=UPI0040295A72
METCLEILKEQVNNLKANYFNFMGSFTNMFEFSNYTMIKINDNENKYIDEYKEINSKLKNLHTQILELGDEIVKL